LAILAVVALVALPFDVGAKTAIIGATALTGGGTGALDAVECEDILGDGSNRAIATGDFALVMTSTKAWYVYRYLSTGSDSEVSPQIIVPDDRADCSGAGQWELVESINVAPTAAPGTVYRDVDCTDNDDNVYWTVNCTDLDSGEEDCDIALYVQIAGTATKVFEIDADVDTYFLQDLDLAGDVVVGGSDLTLGAAGVKLTGDGDGAITFLGLGNGSDEDLTINLDDTSNTVTVSSSTGVTDLNFSALNLVTTGTVQGHVKVTNKSTDATLSDAEMDGVVFVTATATITLPAVEIGQTVCVYSTTAAAVHVDVNASDRTRLNGTALSDGDKITSASAAGDFVCLIGDSADGWTTLGRSGTWTDGN
jgi:hypothetical protein